MPNEKCEPCFERGRCTTATRRVGDEWMCEKCFLGEDAPQGDRFCKRCGMKLSQFSKTDYCSSLHARLGPVVGPELKTLRVKDVYKVAAPIVEEKAVVSPVVIPVEVLCKCGCGGSLPKKNTTGWIWKHWPEGTRPWSTVAKNKDRPIEVPVERGRSGKSVSPEVLGQVRSKLKEGLSIRQILAVVPVAKGTVDRTRAEMRGAGELPENCSCGRPNGHKGWCSGRVRESPARQETIARLHESRRTVKFEESVTSWELAVSERLGGLVLSEKGVDIPDNPPEYTEIAEHAVQLLSSDISTTRGDQWMESFWNMEEKAALVLAHRKAKQIVERRLQEWIDHFGVEISSESGGRAALFATVHAAVMESRDIWTSGKEEKI